MDIPTPPEDLLLALNRSATIARLLASVVHEVNNALQTISGTVEVLEQRADLQEPIARALERLRRQSARAATALADVTAFAQATLDQRGPVNVRDVARHVVQLRVFAITRAHLTIHFDDGGGQCLVLGNGGQLQQAILNLIVNGEEALAGTRGRISVGVSETENSVVVRVADDGPGLVLPADRIFEPFVSAHPPAKAAGLGLWAARAIAEAHQGTLQLDPHGPGASFVLRLPRLAAPAG